jgi:hypothetical protein
MSKKEPKAAAGHKDDQLARDVATLRTMKDQSSQKDWRDLRDGDGNRLTGRGGR